MTEKNGEHDATVRTLTAEVRVLMVGSRQVTMSVYSQLDEVWYDEIEPFGRVRPKGEDDYIHLVGRSKADGTLVRSKTPSDIRLMGKLVGFSYTEEARLGREAEQLDSRAEFFEKHPEANFADEEGAGTSTGAERAAGLRSAAAAMVERMGQMNADFRKNREPYMVRRDEAEKLPLIVLAGLR